MVYNMSGGSYAQVWYSASNGGTFCAKTYDNIAGSHHMEIVVRRDDWQTPAYETGTYTTYAGGIAVYGVDAPHCAWIFGRVTVNGVNREVRDLLC